MIQRPPRPRHWPLLALLALVGPAGAEEADSTTGSLVPEQITTRTLSIMSVTDNIHVAMGYDKATMTLIEGPEGLVIIDSLGGERAATEAMAAFREISDKPVAAVILTHSHRDHSGGLAGVIGAGGVPVYSRAATLASPAPADGDTFPHGAGSDDSAAPPTITLRQPITDRHPLDIAGLRLELVAAKGDDSQQLWVWYPAKGALLSGDLFYTSFPAIHALKDVVADSRHWIASLDTMLQQSPRFLITSHGYPIVGPEQSLEALKHYRDAIALVVEDSLAGIHQGLGPDALVAKVRLPPELAGQPYLEERFARLPWAVRAIHADQRGWFDGNPSHLEPLAPAEQAARIAELAGGPEALLEAGLLALDNGDHGWAAQLADYLLALDPQSAPARHMKADALVGLAEGTSVLPAREFYLKAARQLRQGQVE